MHPWPELKWWDSGERQVVEEKIDELEHDGVRCCPSKKSLYKALSATPFDKTVVAIIGQDPYPTPGIATGVAFSIDREIRPSDWPPTLKLILREYHSDLHYDLPDHGDLHRWTSQGVLLWNAIPSCQSGRSLSNDWDEWNYLTGEIVERLSQKGVFFAFLGNVASRHAFRVNQETNRVIKTSHPSPKGNQFGKHPFSGSRIFSRINAASVELGQHLIDWELKDVPLGKSVIQGPSMGGSTVLPNITGAVLGGLKRTATSPNIYTSLAF